MESAANLRFKIERVASGPAPRDLIDTLMNLPIECLASASSAVMNVAVIPGLSRSWDR